MCLFVRVCVCVEFECEALLDGQVDGIAYWFVIAWSEEEEGGAGGKSRCTETLAGSEHFPGAPHGQVLPVKEVLCY